MREDIKRILELDKKRTQGEWRAGTPINNEITYVGTDIGSKDGYLLKVRIKDAKFIAESPKMAEIILKQQEALDEAYKQLSLCPIMVGRPSCSHGELAHYVKQVEERVLPILKQLKTLVE